MTETIRAFVAIGIPDVVKHLLCGLECELKDMAIDGLRTVNPSGMHLTLKFLGNISVRTATVMAAALRIATSGTPPFLLTLSNLGTFPETGFPKVFWVGVSGDVDALHVLQSRIETVAGGLGFLREGRVFNPHLTVARIRNRISYADSCRVREALGSLSPTGLSVSGNGCCVDAQ